MFAGASLQLAPIGPAWLIMLVAAGILAAIATGSVAMLRRHAPPRWVATLGALRLAAWGLFILILLQPAIVSTRTAEPHPDLLVLLDTSQSMAHPAGNGSRFDEVCGQLQHGEFAEVVRARFQPHWFTFDRTAVRIEPGQLSQLKPSGSDTRLADALHAAHALMHAEDRTPRRVLLVSDGIDHGPGDVAELAHRLGVKIDVIAPRPHANEQPSIVRVAEVQAARRVLLGSETHFRVTVQATPPPTAAQKLTLRLSADGKELQALPIVLKEGQAEQVLMLAHRPSATGTQTFAFQLDPAQGVEPKQVTVKVLDSKYEILVLEDAWRWEYKYLHRLFEDDPSFRFTALLPRSGGGFVQFASPDRRVNLVGFPQSGAGLESFDLFFVGDVQASRWPRGLPEAIARLVADEGKSLVVIAGPRLGSFADVPALHALLPVEVGRASGTPVSGVIDVQSRPEASASPLFFQLGKDAALPPLDHVYPAVRKRAGATVLLEAAKQRNDYGPLIVLAEHTVGRGRVLFVGTDTLWKWHTLAAQDGPTPYALFWQQALRALTPQRTQVGPVQAWITVSRTHTETGHPVTIETAVQSARSHTAVKLQAFATAPDGKRLPLAFTADPTNPDQFRTTLTPASPGTHRIQATVFLDGKQVAEGRSAFEVEKAREESQDTEVNVAGLRRIAAATGGTWIDPTDPQSWPQPEADLIAAIPQVHTFDLWGSFTLLLLLLAVLATDWVLRIMKGLV